MEILTRDIYTTFMVWSHSAFKYHDYLR
jgi:hypothetical protein